MGFSTFCSFPNVWALRLARQLLVWHPVSSAQLNQLPEGSETFFVFHYHIKSNGLMQLAKTYN